MESSTENMTELHALIASEKQKRRNEMQRIENALLNQGSC